MNRHLRLPHLFVRKVHEGERRLAEGAVLSGRDEERAIEVEVALQYNDSISETVVSYCNNINTIEGGTHLTGFRTALTRTPVGESKMFICS